MTLYQITQRLQNLPVTRHWWVMYQHLYTRQVISLPWFKTPGPEWSKTNFKN